VLGKDHDNAHGKKEVFLGVCDENLFATTVKCILVGTREAMIFNSNHDIITNAHVPKRYQKGYKTVPA